MEREESGGVAGDGEERAWGEGSVRREGEGGVAVEGPAGETDWGGRAIEELDEFGVELTFRGGRCQGFAGGEEEAEGGVGIGGSGLMEFDGEDVGALEEGGAGNGEGIA